MLWRCYIDLTNIKGGSQVTLSSSKVGYLGGATVNNAGLIHSQPVLVLMVQST